MVALGYILVYTHLGCTCAGERVVWRGFHRIAFSLYHDLRRKLFRRDCRSRRHYLFAGVLWETGILRLAAMAMKSRSWMRIYREFSFGYGV